MSCAAMDINLQVFSAIRFHLPNKISRPQQKNGYVISF